MSVESQSATPDEPQKRVNVGRRMFLGVAALGATYAALGGGSGGFSAAMLAGGTVQLAGAAAAFALIRRESVQGGG